MPEATKCFELKNTVMNERVKAAEMLARSVDQAVLSSSPIRLPALSQGQDLAVRVSAPATGRDLPVILFFHGNGSSADGYGPLVQGWAA
jgi:predicted dienelactone hydrolase